MSSVSLVVTELTPPGRGAVSVIELRGKLASVDAPTPLWRAANGRPLSRQACDRICFGQWGSESPEDVVVCRLGLELAEVHCHGGRAAVARILGDLRARGASVHASGDALRRLIPLVDAECQLALTHAATERTTDLLAEQASGVLRAALESLGSKLSADGDSAGIETARQGIDDLLRWAPFGQHLTQPWSVVLCGEPNAGKSSLMNALAGFARSIVSEQPGTTRDLVTTEIVLDGWRIELSDTAGLRDADGEIEAEGVRRATQRLAAADLTILLIDGSQPWTSRSDQLLRENQAREGLVIRHKSDLPQAWMKGETPFLSVSSRTGAGVEDLCDAMVTRLVPRVPSPGTPIPISPTICQQLRNVASALQTGATSAARIILAGMLSPTPPDGG